MLLMSLPEERRMQVEIKYQEKSELHQRLCFGYGVMMIMPNEEIDKVYLRPLLTCFIQCHKNDPGTGKILEQIFKMSWKY